MEYSRLGSTDLEVSRISMGCMSLSPVDSVAEPVVLRALELGINYFDTADIYNDGANELMLGRVLKGKRSSVVIASKAGNVRRKDGGLDWNPSRKHIMENIEASLKRLNTDYIDNYQLHGGTIQDNIDESIRAFEDLKKQGKIRHYGISSIRPNVINEYIKRSSIVSVMMQYSLLDRRPEEHCLTLLQQKGIGVLTRGSVAQGLLSGKPAREYLGLEAAEVQKAAVAIFSLSGDYRTSTQTALKYVLQQPAVTSVVLGMRTVAHVEEAAGTLGCADLTAGELEQLRESVRALTYQEHRI